MPASDSGAPNGVQSTGSPGPEGLSSVTACTSSLRVRYAETDKMGIAYYANYFVWFEVGRCDLLRTVGSTYKKMEEDGLQLPVIEAQCTFRQPARYDDELEIATRGAALSPVRVEFSYRVVRRADGVLAAEGRTVHAALDARGRPQRLPDTVLRVLA